MDSIKKGGLYCEKVCFSPHFVLHYGYVYAFGHYAYDRL